MPKIGFNHSEKSKKLISEHNARFWLGKKRPEISAMLKATRTGERNPYWKGGITNPALYKKRWKLNHPEVVRIHTINRRARIRDAKGVFSEKEWIELKRNYGNVCLGCGRKESEILLTPDHVVPISKGGSNGIENIQPLCESCNYKKQAKILDYRAKSLDAQHGWQEIHAVNQLNEIP